MSGFYEVKLKVRDCELDQFLVYVLNYVVSTQYLCWMTQTDRDELMECIGFNSNEVAQSGDAVAVSELSLKFFQPLRSGDKVVKVRISGSSGAQVYLDHLIFKLPYEELILEAKAHVFGLIKIIILSIYHLSSDKNLCNFFRHEESYSA
ncbi:hypothetical protein SLE2022_096960 [Rubroshorea leprosula]